MTGDVIGATFEIMLDVTGEQVFRSGDPRHVGHVSLEPSRAKITYTYGYGRRWRVVQTVLYGVPLNRSSPSEKVFRFGQPDKPLWVAALEHKYYPKENPK